MSDSKALKNKFSNWLSKIQFSFLENDIFQPIGLELSCVDINFETLEDYSFKGIEESNINSMNYPLAYYRPDTDSIHIFIEHESFKKRFEDSEKMAFLMFLLFHEANHRLLMHTKRNKDKDGDLWNIAADMEIHNMLYVYKELLNSDRKYETSIIYKFINNYIDSFLFIKNDRNKSEGLWERDFLQYTAEEIYAALQNSKEEHTESFSLNIKNENNSDESKSSNSSQTVTIKETTYTLPSKQKITTTNIIFPDIKHNGSANKEDEKNKEASALTRKTLMENNLIKKVQDSFDEESSRSRGFMSAECKKFLKKLFHIKIDWKKILRSSLQTALEKSEYFSWAKPRTSLFGLPSAPYLPDQIEDEIGYGTVIIARDESGSMTEKECEAAASIIIDAKEYYKKIVIIKHDSKISSFREMEDIDENGKKYLLERDSYGGTSHKEVFEFINNYSKANKENERISCCIFITDMYSDIKETQNIISDEIPRIYITVPSSAENSYGIKGKIIPIEL